MPPVTDFHAAMTRALASVSPRIVTLDETGSTNDDARALAREGAPHLSVVTANMQTAGRGRLDRSWWSEPGSTLIASWIARPSLPVDRWTLLPLLAGVATVRAVRHRTKVAAALKWPNDVRVGERKLGGILAEAEVPDFVVVGLGLNVAQTTFPPELAPIATSLAVEGAQRLHRADLLAFVLRYFEEALDDVEAAIDFYRRACTTLGAPVRVERAGTAPLTGTAVDVDAHGSLVVATPEGERTVSSGDVVHLRHELRIRSLPPDAPHR